MKTNREYLDIARDMDIDDVARLLHERDNWQQRATKLVVVSNELNNALYILKQTAQEYMPTVDTEETPVNFAQEVGKYIEWFVDELKGLRAKENRDE